MENDGDGDCWDSGGGDMGGSLGSDEAGNDDHVMGSAVTGWTAPSTFRTINPNL